MLAVMGEQPCFVSLLHITPDDEMASRLEMSQRRGSRVEGAQHRLGEGVADDGDHVHPFPLDRVEQLDRVERAARQGHDEPPCIRAMIDVMPPVPCICGQAGTAIGPGAANADRATS